MNVINGSKSFYRYMKRDAIVLAYFYVDDSALTNGVKAFVNLVEDFSDQFNSN